VSPPLKVGIVLEPPGGEPGAWLADGAAFEAAGADALWIDCGSEHDPVPLTAALAAVTYRSRLLVRVPEPLPDRTRVTLEQLSRGRLEIVTGDPPPDADPADEDQAGEGAWLPVPVPESRAAWQAIIADAGEQGFPGVLVPADPRMLDLLRNPGQLVDRRDLEIAQG
jgi:alkanesulfonate monooxygenase SsuD/methylene tetrahydromethanopterin reductase-like flavin-dependent oxidoreductase (luciferase family)